MSLLNKKNVTAATLSLVLIVVLTELWLYSRQPIEIFSDISVEKVLPKYSGINHIDYNYYNNYDDVNRKVDLVLIGEVIGTKDEKIITGETFTANGTKLSSHIYTVSDFRVNKVIKGNLKVGDIVKVKQDWISSGTQFFEPGERHVLFLEDFKNSRYKAPLSPINPLQGNIQIINGKTKRRSDYQLINDGIPENLLVEALIGKTKNKK
jgi:hypothetical protein